MFPDREGKTCGRGREGRMREEGEEEKERKGEKKGGSEGKDTRK